METKDIEFRKGTISHLQEYITQNIGKKGVKDKALKEKLLLLSEEVGELINSCKELVDVKTNGDYKMPDEISKNIIDIINMIFAIGIKLGLDIEKEFLSKEKETDRAKSQKFSNKTN